LYRVPYNPPVAAVVFYISGHGFGHASREVEVIHALGRLRPDLGVVIRSAVSPALLARTVQAPYELLPGPCDPGIVQSTSVAHDDEATRREAIAFYADLPSREAGEIRLLARRGVRAIVADIPPLAFDVAAALGVPGLAIANFTWDWVYDTHPGMREAAPWLVPALRASYRKATLALELPFSGGFEVFADVRPIPLIARHATRTRADTRAHFGLPAGRRVALLSFGGYGLPGLDLSALDCLDTWTVVTTDRSTGGRRAGTSPVVCLAEAVFGGTGYRYEDLVAAADVVVTKPGYGIIAECIAAGTAMLYTSRGQFREYDRLVRELPRYVRSRFIDQAALFAGRWRGGLDALMDQPAPPETMATDGAAAAAAAIAERVRR
jgi:hypothetical protein